MKKGSVLQGSNIGGHSMAKDWKLGKPIKGKMKMGTDTLEQPIPKIQPSNKKVNKK